jgi:hypothetical protein
MSKPVLNSFNVMGELIVQKYERYLPTAFDDSLSLLEKVNKVIEYCNQLGLLTNGLVEKWNEVMLWVMNDGLNESVIAKLNSMVDDGTLADIINVTIFNELNTRIGNVENDLTQTNENVVDIQTKNQSQDTEINNLKNSQTTQDNTISNISTQQNSLIGRVSILEENTIFVSNEGTVSEVTQRLQNAINEANGKKIVVLKGEYILNQTIIGGDANILSLGATLKFTNSGDGLAFKGTLKTTSLTATGGYSKGRQLLFMNNTSGIEKGDLIRFLSTSELYHPARSYYYKGMSAIIDRVEIDAVYFGQTAPYDMSSVNVVEIYKPAKVNIEGKLRIENTGALPNGQRGLVLERCVLSKIEGVTVDNFDTCISSFYSVHVTFKNCRTERAYYTGSGQSYGFATISSNFVSYDNCVSRTGRHGHTAGGFEPCDHIYMKNCAWYCELETGQKSLDFHENVITIQIENCEMDCFNLQGNVIMKGCTVHHRESVFSTYGSSDNYAKSNYLFENIYLPNGGQIKLSGYSQSGGTWSMDKIGSIKLINVYSPLAVQFAIMGKDVSGLAPQRIRNVSFENTHNIMLLMKDTIDNVHIKNFSFEQDAVYIFQYGDASIVNNITIENIRTVARYTGIQLLNFKRATFIGCSDYTGGLESPINTVASPSNAHVVFMNCEFNAPFSVSVDSYTLIDSYLTYQGSTTGIKKEL